MAREVIAFGLIAFWLCFGFAVMFFNSQMTPDFTFTDKDKQISENPITFIWDNVGLFLKCLTLTIPGVPFWASFLVILLQLFTLIIIIFLIRS